MILIRLNLLVCFFYYIDFVVYYNILVCFMTIIVNLVVNYFIISNFINFVVFVVNLIVFFSGCERDVSFLYLFLLLGILWLGVILYNFTMT